jgi:transposase
LAEANRRGWYRVAHRVSVEQQGRRQVLGARRHLVQLRTGTVSVIRATLRQGGYRVGSGTSATLVRRVERLGLPPALAETLQPLLATVTALTIQIHAIEKRLVAVAATDAIVGRLQTAPGIGAIVALSYRAFVDDVHRFRSAAHVSAAMGLVPRESSSAERRHRGHLTKVGPAALRSLMVQAAWSHWRTVRSGPLRAWVDQLAARRGKRIAVVALARRLSRILFALWRDETVFTDSRVTA